MSKDTTLQTAAEHYESLRGFLASHIQKCKYLLNIYVNKSYY